jgi:uroporphyrinogen-III synthase
VSEGLRGARVLITRAAGDQQALAALLRERGAEPLSLPCIAFAPPSEPAPLEQFLAALASGVRPAALALASPQAVRRLVAALEGHGLDPRLALAGVRIGVAGEGTARELEPLGLDVLSPKSGAGAEALAAELGPLVRGAKVALLRAEEGNPELPRLLAAAGAVVESIALYRTVPQGPEALASLDAEAARALAALQGGQVAAVLFASGSAARGFAAMLGDEAMPLAAKTLVACMGPRCAADCRRAGLPVDVTSDGGFPELLERVEAGLRARPVLL